MNSENGPQVIELDDIQGLIVRGYGKLTHARFVLLAVEGAAAQNTSAPAKEWIRSLADRVTRADKRPDKTAVQIALTHRGLKAFGVPEETLAGFSIEFEEGMAVGHRSRRLGDTGSSAPDAWEWGGPKTPPFDLMLLLYACDEPTLTELVASETERAEAAGLRKVHELETHTLQDKHGFREHFGFRDGVAQPRIRAHNHARWNAKVGGLLRREREATGNEQVLYNTVEPGEFLLGYKNEYGKFPFSPGVGIDPSRKLRPKTYGRGGFDLGRNGSYLVFRQLDQDVGHFWRFLDGKADGDGAERIRLASKMVGRWPSGTPLTIDDQKDTPGHETENDFGYSRDDVHGDKCPFGSHIRRSNPRDSILAKDPDEARTLSNRHRMIRRGRPYGKPVDASFDLENILERDLSGTRGLQFLCFQSSIARQFEFVQHTWCNSPKFAALYDDPDPIIGDPPEGGSSQMTIQASPVRQRVVGLERWVHVKGGAYLFMPGIAALEYLAAVEPLTPLQKHAAFFDTNDDGAISIPETIRGLHRLGFGWGLSTLLGLIINFALAKLTGGEGLTIRVENIALGKHAFDTGIFDEKGEFDEGALNALFESTGRASNPPDAEDAITRDEMNDFIDSMGARGRPFPKFSQFFSRRETQLIFCLAAEEREIDGEVKRILTRARMIEFVRGDLLPKIARAAAFRRHRGFGMMGRKKTPCSGG